MDENIPAACAAQPESNLTSNMTEALAKVDPALAAALVKAAGSVGWVAKDGKNTFAHYQYATSDDVIAEALRVLPPAGLHAWHTWRFVPGCATPDAAAARGTKDGGTAMSGTIGRVLLDCVLLHCSGATMRWSASLPVVLEKGKPADKAELAAVTTCWAYTLRGLLCIPRGDDPGNAIDERDDGPGERRAPERPAQRPAAPRVEPRQPESSPKLEAPSHTQDTPVDVPFEVNSEWDAPVFAALCAVADAPTVRDVLAITAQAAALSGLPASRLTDIRRAACRRLIVVASSVPELAELGGLGKALKAYDDEHGGAADWHAETKRLRDARKAELTK